MKNSIVSVDNIERKKQRHASFGHFIIQDVIVLVHISPIYSNNVNHGIDRHLYQMLLKYDSTWNGIPLCYFDASIISPMANIVGDNPFIHVYVRTKILIFRPNLGQTIEGVINRVSSNHIGLVVYGLFNASIPMHKLDRYFWDSSHNSWKLKSDSKKDSREFRNEETLFVTGKTLKFRVTGIKRDAQLIAIVGGLKQSRDLIA